MPRRKLADFDNKYSRGVIGIAAGSKKFPGAAVLAVGGARRGNAGYVKFLSKDSKLLDLVIDKFPDVVPIQTLDNERVDVLVVGPGASRWSVIPVDLPLVLDGEMIAFATTSQFRKRKAYSVVTPHDGELRYFGKDFSNRINEIGREGAAREIANKFDVIVVLKGHQTVIAKPGNVSKVDRLGGPELATAGTGDVLAGLIGSFLVANDGDPFELVCDAVDMHSRAGKEASKRYTSVTAVEVLEQLAQV